MRSPPRRARAAGVRLKQGDAREPVSAADMAADELLRDSLAARHPADAISPRRRPWVAQGRLDRCLFWRNDRIWDWLAGTRLVRDAGGTVTTWGETIPRATVAASALLARASQPAG